MAGKNTTFRTIVTTEEGTFNDYAKVVNTPARILEDYTVAISQTNKELDLSFLFAQVAAYEIVADFALTLKTNSTGSPDETISLAAGVPIKYDGTGTSVFGHDVTKIYATNASGVNAAHLQVLIGLNNVV